MSYHQNTLLAAVLNALPLLREKRLIAKADAAMDNAARPYLVECDRAIAICEAALEREGLR